MKQEPEVWTHKSLVQRISAWLKYTKGHTVVMAELHTQNSETPDVIGWVGVAESTLVECKRTRADFLADGRKWFRRSEEQGVGDRRYIAAPAGLLCADEMPDGWGMLEVTARQVRITKEARRLVAHKGRECVMLMSALRRLEIATAVYVVHQEVPPLLMLSDGLVSRAEVERQGAEWAYDLKREALERGEVPGDAKVDS